MKNIFLVFSLLVSTACFGQVDSKSMLGDWVYADLTGEPGNGGVVDYSLNLSDDGKFEITTANYFITGSWELNESVLVLDGERSDKTERRVEELVIHTLTESALSFTIDSETDDKVLMNLVRKN
jgi:hypothetical protein